MFTTTHVLETLTRYIGRFPEEGATIDPLRGLIAEGADVLSRKEFRGHVTCGAIVLREDGRVLLIRHKALDKWLAPGGHVEQADASLMLAALRELREETGLTTARVAEHWVDVPVDVDCHAIPANEKKGEPGHEHWDFRFLFHVPAAVAMVLDENEVSEWRWAEAGAHSEKLGERARKLNH